MRAPEFDFLGIAIPRIFTAPNCTLGIVLSERNGFSYEYFSKTNPQMMHLTKHGTRGQLAIDVGLTANSQEATIRSAKKVLAVVKRWTA